MIYARAGGRLPFCICACYIVERRVLKKKKILHIFYISWIKNSNQLHVCVRICFFFENFCQTFRLFYNIYRIEKHK